MKKLIVAALVSSFAGSQVFAGIKAYSGQAGEKIYVEVGADTKKALIKVSGITSEWNDKVIATRVKPGREGNDTYVIDYEQKHGYGRGKKEYNFVDISNDKTLINGTIAQTGTIYFPGAPKERVPITYDKDLTAKSQAKPLNKEPLFTPMLPDKKSP